MHEVNNFFFVRKIDGLGINKTNSKSTTQNPQKLFEMGKKKKGEANSSMV